MTTALKKYHKLEGMGLWSGAVEEQRREVVVSFGDATLVIMDSRSMHVLSHWSLAAIERLNPGKRPALFSPDGDASEVLELDEDLLIDALKELHAALAPPKGLIERLRVPIMGALSLLVLGLGAFLLPPALVDHTASVVPMAKRTEIAERLLAELRQTGATQCQSSLGTNALGILQRRLFDAPARLVILRDLSLEAPRIQHLPGRLFVVDARLVDQAESVEALAGALVLAGARAAADDPLRPLLRHAGVFSTFRLLTSGELRPNAIRGYARAVLNAPVAVPDIAAIQARFERLELSPGPLLANATPLDPALGQISDQLRADMDTLTQSPRGALLNDGQWVSLLNICDS
ncbi:hypothetical protein [Roseinatronobacter alkalisoli]|uniref:GspL cytoplasmic actin-ATPase-like domain-containing protein n=1 Tax=Roseinatronobacter alkalisoli TaxID=3028235 RepID=A0ABT5T5S8_9RHOB|nr:hypothetical protein [Roseinatronobacter sp. HJB301]MDD7969766.1 hypothetical protein [Roseinatronobacter sp. HJB301]